MLRLPKRLAPVALAAATLLLPTASAAAATQIGSLAIATYPAGYYGSFDTSTGAFSGYYESASGAYTTDTVQIRGGAVIAERDDGVNTGDPISVQPGDVFQIRAKDGSVVTQTTYSGAPALTSAPCIGSSIVIGVRDGGASMIVGKATKPITGRGAYSTDGVQRASVALPVPGQFTATFASPLAFGEYLDLDQSSTSTDATNVGLDLESIVPSAYCAPAPTPAVDRTPPAVSGFAITRASRAAFLRSGLTTTLTLSEPATVTQALYLDNGAKVPAQATAARAKRCRKGYVAKTVTVSRTVRGHRRKLKRRTCVKARRLTLLGRGSATGAAAGPLTVTVKATGAGRAALKRSASYRAILVTTVRDLAGNVTALPSARVTLGRR